MNGETLRRREMMISRIIFSPPLRLSVQLLLAWALLSSMPLQAQKGLSLSLHAGPLLEINPVYPETSRLPYFGEIGYIIPIQEESLWQQVHPNLRISYTTHLLNLGNPEVLGFGIGQTVDLNVPIYQGARFRIDIKYGSGLGWLSKTFDRATNPSNNAIGSHLNSLTRIAMQVDYVGPRHITPFLRFSYTHFSNSRVRVPNLGVNIPALGIGVKWRRKPISPIQQPNLDLDAKKDFLSLRLGTGFATVPASHGPVYPVYVGAIAYNHTLPNLRFRWKVGLESFVNYASYAILKDYDQPYPQTAWNSTGIIAFTGVELLIGRFSSIAHLGPYLKTAFQMNYKLYTKLGVKYHLRDQHKNPRHQPFVGVFMHAHSGESDFLEVGLGWNL